MVRKAAAVKEEANRKLKEKHGKDLVTMASEISPVFDIRLPTGLPGMDVALEGGIPRGIIAEIAGPDSTGKNALAYQIGGTYQKMRGKKCGIALCPIEGEIDKYFARKLGFQIPLSKPELRRMELRLGRPLTKEEHDDFTCSIGRVGYVDLDVAEKMLQTVLDITKTDDFGLVIVDSVAAMLAQDDVERKDQQGRMAEVMVGGERPYARNINSVIGSFTNRFPQARKCKPHDKDNLTTIIMINQVRADVSGKGLPWKVAGAHALRHAKRVDIWLNNGAWVKDKDDKVIGHYVRWNMAKGQYGVHEHASGSIRFLYDTGFDVIEDLFTTLHDHNMLVHTGGGKWDLCDGDGEVVESYGKDIGGKDGLIEAARTDESVQEKWRTTLATIYAMPPIYEGYDE
jgi:RecA/RadA recombinase